MRLILSAEPNLEVASLEEIWLLLTSSGTFSSTPYLTRGYNKLDAYLVGGGGPGGYGRTTSDTDFAGGGGGGGGSGGLSQFNDRYLATYDGAQAYTVGLGGVAASAGTDRPGGNTIFGDLIAYGGGSGGLGSLGTGSTNGYGGGGGGGAGIKGPGVHGGNGVGAGANGGAGGPNTGYSSVGGSNGYGGVGAGTSGNNAAVGHLGFHGEITPTKKIGGGGGGGGGHATNTANAVGAGGGYGLGGEASPSYNVTGVGGETVGGGGGGGAGGHNVANLTPFPQLHGQLNPQILVNDNYQRLIGVGAGGHGGHGWREIVSASDSILAPENGYPGLIVLRIHQ